MDLWVASKCDSLKSCICYFENVGSTTSPSWVYNNEDNPFAQRSFDHITDLHAKDMDHDGLEDLVIGLIQGNINFYKKNESIENGDVLREMNFINNSLDPFDNLDVGSSLKLDFIDINSDGREEIVFGRAEQGVLKFFVPGEGCFVQAQECGQNTWIGPNEDWNSSPLNWSLGRIPESCDDVVIPAFKKVTLKTGKAGRGNSIILQTGAEIITQHMADLEISNKN